MVKATAQGKGLAISPKYTFMVCQYIRGRKLARAKAILEAVIEKKEAIPFTKFNDGVGHRVGIAASGRYPFKACTAVLALLNSAEANATNKGLTGELILTECRANRATAPMRQGRQSRRIAKRTHVHITLEELESKPITTKTKIIVPVKTETAKPKAPVKAPKVAEASESKPKAETKPAEKPAASESKPKAEIKPAAKPAEPKKTETPKPKVTEKPAEATN